MVIINPRTWSAPARYAFLYVLTIIVSVAISQGMVFLLPTHPLLTILGSALVGYWLGLNVGRFGILWLRL